MITHATQLLSLTAHHAPFILRQLPLILMLMVPLCKASVIRRPAVSSAGATNPSAKETVIVLPDPVVTPAPPTEDAGAGSVPDSRRGTSDREARIINYQSDNYQDGYHFQFETTNGIKHEEAGQIFSGPLPMSGVISTEGRVSWRDPAGVQIVLYWHADENGYQPHGIQMISKHQRPENQPNFRRIEEDFKLLHALRENRLNPPNEDTEHDEGGGVVSSEKGDDSSTAKEGTVESQNIAENKADSNDVIVNPLSSNEILENIEERQSLLENVDGFLQLPKETIQSSSGEKDNTKSDNSSTDSTEPSDLKDNAIETNTIEHAAEPENLPESPANITEADTITSTSVTTLATASTATGSPITEELGGPDVSSHRTPDTQDTNSEPRDELSLPSRTQELAERHVSDGALLQLAALSAPDAAPTGKERKRIVRKVVRRRIIQL